MAGRTNGTYELVQGDIASDRAPVYKRKKLHKNKGRFLYFAKDRSWRGSGPLSMEGRAGDNKGTLRTSGKKEVEEGTLPHKYNGIWEVKSGKRFTAASKVTVKNG